MFILLLFELGVFYENTTDGNNKVKLKHLEFFIAVKSIFGTLAKEIKIKIGLEPRRTAAITTKGSGSAR